MSERGVLAGTEAPATPARRRVLVCDDDPIHQRVLRQVLRNSDLECHLVTSGPDALAAAMSQPFDAILITCDSAAIDGYATALSLRGTGPVSDTTPVIALTSSVLNTDQRRRISAGFDSYIGTPIETGRMRAILERYLPDPETQSVASPLAALSQVMVNSIRKLVGDDPALIGELIDIFLENAPRQISAMRRAHKAQDAAGLAMAAHTLKGGCAQLGLTHISEIARAIEGRAASGAVTQELAALLGDLEHGFLHVSRDLMAAKLSGVNSGEVGRGPASDTVLVAEDDELIVQFLRSGLARAGMNLAHAPDGLAALDMLRTRPFIAVVLDINMPKLDGYGVLAEMRRNPWGKEVPVMVLSSRNQEQEIVRAFDLGVDDFVTKPFSPLEVVSRIKRLIRRR